MGFNLIVFYVGAQEEELTKLYDILETQRQEIEHLNHLLDTMAGGGSAAGQDLQTLSMNVLEYFIDRTTIHLLAKFYLILVIAGYLMHCF